MVLESISLRTLNPTTFRDVKIYISNNADHGAAGFVKNFSFEGDFKIDF